MKNKLGNASVTGYCIRFRALKDINIDTLEAAIQYGLQLKNEKGKKLGVVPSGKFACSEMSE